MVNKLIKLPQEQNRQRQDSKIWPPDTKMCEELLRPTTDPEFGECTVCGNNAVPTSQAIHIWRERQ